MQGIGLGKYSEFEIAVGYKCRKNVLMKLLADIYRLENEGFLLENSIMTHAGHSQESKPVGCKGNVKGGYKDEM